MECLFPVVLAVILSFINFGMSVPANQATFLGFTCTVERIETDKTLPPLREYLFLVDLRDFTAPQVQDILKDAVYDLVLETHLKPTSYRE